jgi:hypothetical protein
MSDYQKNYLRKSGLVGVKMIEAFDLVKIRRIMQADAAKDPIARQLNDDDIKKMDAYLQSFDGMAERTIKYEFGATSDCDYGRLYGNRSFGQFWSYVKNTVCYDLDEHGTRSSIYIDIDMENCQANIMWQIATTASHGINLTEIDLPQFKRYIKKREIYMNEVMKHYKVSKRLTKLLFTSLMNGGTLYGWQRKNDIHCSEEMTCLKQFAAEAELIAERFMGKKPAIYARITSDVEFKSEDNLTAKVFSRVIKNIEALCLEKLYIRLKKPKYGTLEHDGMRVRRADYSDDELIEAMGGAMVDIKNDIDIDISVSFKPKVPTEQEFLPMADISAGDEGFECFDNDIFESLNTYQEKKKYFEIFHFLVLTPTPKYYHLYWKDEGYGGRLEFNDWNAKTDLNTAYRNRFFIEMVKTEKEVKGEKVEKLVPKKVKFVDRWLDDPKIRTYNEIDFIPSNKIASKLQYWDGKNERKYNSFLGYSLKCLPISVGEQLAASLLKTWTDLVFELCGANQKFYDLYINALAHKIQFPNEKSRAGCFIFKSLQGSGKNMSLTPFETILGEYYISSSEERDFWGTYADSFYRKILVNLNEMQLDKNGHEYEGKIKAFITEEWMSMNQKFKKVRKVRNTALPIIFTNKPKPFAIDFRTGDRRINATEATTKYQQYGEDFWTGMHKVFKSDKFISIFYKFLCDRDISNVSWKQVKTPAYLEMAMQFVPIEILWLGDWVENQINMHNAFARETWETRFTVSDLYTNYMSFCTDYNIKADMVLNKHKFTTTIVDLNLGITAKKSSIMVFDMDLVAVKEELINRKLIIRDDVEPAIEVEEAPKNNISIFEMYGFNPEDI